MIDHEVEVQLVDTVPGSKSLSLVPQATDTDTILVKGLKECHTESTLKFFFTNKKKCGGGDVTKISINKESAYVSFADPKGRHVRIKYNLLNFKSSLTLIFCKVHTTLFTVVQPCMMVARLLSNGM